MGLRHSISNYGKKSPKSMRLYHQFLTDEKLLI